MAADGRLAAGWLDRLRPDVAGYARVALKNIAAEFPSWVSTQMDAPGDFPNRPRDRSPVFFGSYDWHSCVEMHWLLVRLLRVAADAVPEAEIRAALDAQFTEAGLAAEAAFMSSREGASTQRPYGWGWALILVHELAAWQDEDARRWAAFMRPLADAITANYLGWLPVETYPVRSGLHPNSAFGISRALPYAELLAGQGRPRLRDALADAARRWYSGDRDYPGGWEPSGHDFLSAALTEAELMARLLPRGEFPGWLAAFLPGIESGLPAALFTPVTVSDDSDGQIAHLHGLNLSRAWCWRRLAESLQDGDARVERCLDASLRHAEAALPRVSGSDYMVEHWLAVYAVLMFS